MKNNLSPQQIKELNEQTEKLRREIEYFSYGLSCDMLDPFHTAEYTQMISKKKEQYVLAVHNTKIQEQHGTRGNGSSYVVFATRPNGESKYIKSSTYDGLIEKLYAHYCGEDRDTTLRSIFKDATLWKSGRGVAGKTIVEYTRIWEKYFANDKIADLKIEKLDVFALTDFYDRTVAGYNLTYSQTQNLRNVISYIMQYCIKQRLINHNPAIDVDYNDFPYKKTTGRKDKIKKVPLPPERIPEMIQWCRAQLDNPRVNVLHPYGIIIGLKLGDRYGELLGMRWSDINFVERTLTISSQSVPVYTVNDDLTFNYEGRKPVDHIKGYEEPIPIPIPEDAFDALLKIRELNLSDEFVFPKNHFRINTFNDYIKKMAEYLGLDPSKYSSHSLRTTAATDLFLKTRDVFLVQRLLHHTTPKMTSQYIKDVAIDERLRKAMIDEEPGSLTKEVI